MGRIRIQIRFMNLPYHFNGNVEYSEVERVISELVSLTDANESDENSQIRELWERQEFH